MPQAVEAKVALPEIYSRRKPSLRALTGIRFFAAVYVMLLHYGSGFSKRSHLPEPLTTFLEHGNLGVFVFFTLSGFILFYSYEHSLSARSQVYRFLGARLARLYPMYLLVIMIQGADLTRLPEGKELLIFPMLQAWGFPVSTLGYTWISQLWSLSVEVFFYCCFPFLVSRIQRLNSLAILWTTVAFIAALTVALQTPFAHPDLGDGWVARHVPLPLLCLPDFLLGMLLCAIHLKKKDRPHAKDSLTVLGIAPGLLVIANSHDFYLLSIAAVWTTGWTIYRLARSAGLLTRFLSGKVMLLAGGASYSMYLLQGPGRVITHKAFGLLHSQLDAAVFPILLILVSCFLFVCYEEPMRALMNKAVAFGLGRFPSGRS